jgi:inositol-phosphate phosphatase/L-galactose 1-phosphate phosphatase/histidinol-phosphatase
MRFSEHPKCGEFVDFAEELADSARTCLMGRNSGSHFVAKEDASPVTEFDREVELRIRAMIRARYPGHGIIGEEFSSERSSAEFVWVIDPIDGTREFVTGIPTFTTLIALCWNTLPIVGVIDSGVTNDRWIGVDGRATRHNGGEVRTSGRLNLDGATVAWSNPEVVLDEHARGQKLLNHATAWRVFGAGNYAYGRLASGALDIAVESGEVIEVDICASVPIVNGAGGRCTDGFGNPISLHSKGSSVAAATPELHEAVIRILNTK